MGKKNSSINILAVDNSAVLVEYYKHLLEKEGYNVKTAESAVEALEILDSFTPDIAIVDLIMPFIKGDKLAELMKDKHHLNDLSVIIVSGIAKEMEEITYSKYIDVYLAKGPTQKMGKQILEIISNLIHKKKKQYSGKVIGIESVYHREVTKELLFSNKHLDVLLSQLPIGVVEIDHHNDIVFANPAICAILQQSENDLLGIALEAVLPKAVYQGIEYHKGEESPENWSENSPFYLGDNIIQLELIPVREGPYYSTMLLFNDITDSYLHQKAIQKNLIEKEILLKDTHHRIKNNLAIIRGLLNLQKDRIDDKVTKEHFNDISSRLSSMSVIHQKLYSGHDREYIDIQDYIQDLVIELFSTLRRSDQLIDVNVLIPNLKMNIEKAVPMGLIISELTTNAIKYGFIPKDENNQFVYDISMEVIDGTCRLTVTNTGAPFPPDIDIKTSGSLGLQIIRTLAEQLAGTTELVRNDNRTSFIFTFPASGDDSLL